MTKYSSIKKCSPIETSRLLIPLIYATFSILYQTEQHMYKSHAYNAMAARLTVAGRTSFRMAKVAYI